MTKRADYDFTAANTEVAYLTDNYFIRTRVPLDGVSAFRPYDSFNHGLSEGPADVEVSLPAGEILMQLKNDYAAWGLGRLQLDLANAPDGTRTYLETGTYRLPALMDPYTDYFATWYGFKEYRIGFNWLSQNDTQFQINIFTRDAWDYLLFGPTINHYIFTTPPTGSFQNEWFGTPSIRIPIDEDFEMQQLIRAGFTDGRWLCMVKLQGEAWQVAWDYQGRTYHPDETVGEDFRMMQPLKIYTNSTLVDWMNVNSGECSLACSRLQCWIG